MNSVLTAVEEPLAKAWEELCGDLPFVTIYQGSIFDVECDAVVSPANSFGFMDGGIDMLYSKHFGWGVQARLQQAIREKHHGELLVGTAEIVETGNEEIPYLIASPTMRVPMMLSNSVNPYLAARAVLLLIQHGKFPNGDAIADKVKTVAFPGLGTGIGTISSATCALQVRAAIDETLLHTEPFPTTWREAQLRHQSLYTSYFTDMQYN